MKCGKAVIVPISPQPKALGSNYAQHPTQTWPSLSKTRFTKEGPVSLQTASQAGEKLWFPWVYGIYTQAHIGGNTACCLKSPGIFPKHYGLISWMNTRYSHWAATYPYVALCSVSPKLLVLQVPITAQNGGEGLEETSFILKSAGCNRNHTS